MQKAGVVRIVYGGGKGTLAVAAGRTSAGTPYLLIGTPGESSGSLVDAGGFHYVSGTAQTVTFTHQNTGDGGALPGAAEQDDRFGSTLATTPTHFAVGAPGEALGARAFAGGVTWFNHTLTSGYPKPLGGLGQDQEAISGDEVGDQFGAALSMVPYRASGAASITESLLTVGVPGEDLTTTVDAGSVQVVPLVGAADASDVWIDPGYGVPGILAPRMLAGLALSATPSLLYVGMPYGPAEERAVYGFPCSVASGGTPTQAFKPGEGGIPATGAAFGATVR